MSRYLVVAHQTAASPELIQRAQAMVARDPEAQFVLLVPATPVVHLLHWEEGEGREIARRRAREATDKLLSAGVEVVAFRIGDASPLQAVDDELRERPGYDAILLSTFPPGRSRWLRGDLPAKLRRLHGLPVEHVIAAPAGTLTTS
jgi:hypothetical protein